MTEIEKWIEEGGSVAGKSFVQCASDIAANVVQQARETFVLNNPRVWWLSLKCPYKKYDSANTSIVAVLPTTKENRVWFIPETDGEPLPVYDLYPDDIEVIRNNCPLFEYYVVDKAYQWIVIESDHDEFIVCRKHQL